MNDQISTFPDWTSKALSAESEPVTKLTLHSAGSTVVRSEMSADLGVSEIYRAIVSGWSAMQTSQIAAMTAVEELVRQIASVGERTFVDRAEGRQDVIWVALTEFDVDRARAIHEREIELSDRLGIDVDVRVTQIAEMAIPPHWREVSRG